MVVVLAFPLALGSALGFGDFGGRSGFASSSAARLRGGMFYTQRSQTNMCCPWLLIRKRCEASTYVCNEVMMTSQLT